MLLNLLEKVCKEHIHNLGEPLANDLIELASTELTKDPVSCLMMWMRSINPTAVPVWLSPYALCGA